MLLGIYCAGLVIQPWTQEHSSNFQLVRKLDTLCHAKTVGPMGTIFGLMIGIQDC